MLWKRVSLRGTTVRWFTICWYILWHCSSSYHFHHGHNFYSSQNKAERERRDLHWSDSWLRYDQPSSTCRFELHRISKLRGGWNKINFKYTEEMTNEHSNSLIFWQLTWIILALWFLFSFEFLTWPVLVPTSIFPGIISVEYGQVTLNYRRCYLMTIICILETQYQSFSLYMYL